MHRTIHNGPRTLFLTKWKHERKKYFSRARERELSHLSQYLFFELIRQISHILKVLAYAYLKSGCSVQHGCLDKENSGGEGGKGEVSYLPNSTGVRSSPRSH